MNFQLYNDKVWSFPIKCQNASGVAQPFPPGTGPNVVSSNPVSLGAAIGLVSGGGFTLELTPKVQVSPGITVTVSSVGMDSSAFVVDIVADPNRLSVAIDSAAAASVAQNVPTAPGP